MTTLTLAISASLIAALQAPTAIDTTHPHVRAHHAAAYHPTDRRLLMTSGSTPLDGGQRFHFFDDPWGFDGSAWRKLAEGGPPARAYDAAPGRRSVADGHGFSLLPCRKY